MTTTATRPVTLMRDGDHFTLAFTYDPELVKRVHQIPLAEWQSGFWEAPVTHQAVDKLRRWHREGLTDVPPDSLLRHGEEPPVCAPAYLRRGSRSRPWIVKMSWSDDELYAKLRAQPGAVWSKQLKALTYPPQSAGAIAALVNRGVIADPDELLRQGDVTVAFDGGTGRFVCLGDPRSQQAWDRYYPRLDVVNEWRDRDIEVGFTDEFAQNLYETELLRSKGVEVHPSGLLVPLMPHQAKNVALALERDGFCVFDGPGVGKTPTGIGFGYEMRFNRGDVPHVVVAVPGALRSQWAAEILRFTPTEPDRVVVVDGDPAKRAKAYQRVASGQADWMIVHYDIMHRDEADLAPLFAGAVVIADEAHKLKSASAKRAKAMRRLSRRAAHRLALTGTPVESVPDEWFWVLEWAVPGALGDFDTFQKRYQYEGRYGFTGCKNRAELRDRSKVHLIRWTKAEVAPHMPPLRVERLLIDCEPRYAALLRQVHRDAAAEIAADRRRRQAHVAGAAVTGDGTALGGALDGNEWDRVAAAAEMTAVGMLRMLTSSPRLLYLSDSPSALALIETGAVPDVDGPKIEQLLDMASAHQSSGDRLVAFTGSLKMAELVSTRLTENGIRHVCFTGSTSRTDRDAAVAAFTTPGTDTDPGPTVFLATDAAAEGLNLGKCCSTLVNVDLPWTPTKLEQRSNRIHRIDGTHSSYRVLNMTLRGTVEEGLVAALEEKAQLADSLLGESGGARRTVGKTKWKAHGTNLLASAFEWGEANGARWAKHSAGPPARKAGSTGPAVGDPVPVPVGTQTSLFSGV